MRRNPQLGRFLGVDPLAASGGQDVFSPYAAMGNAPENIVDPNGTSLMAAKDFNDVRDQRSGFAAAAIKFVDVFGKIWGGSGGVTKEGFTGFGTGASGGAVTFYGKAAQALFSFIIGATNTVGDGDAATNFDPTDGRKQGKGPGPFTSDEELLTGREVNTRLSLSAKGYAFVQSWENDKKIGKGYHDGRFWIENIGDGKNTIGYGITIPDDEVYKYKDGITEFQAVQMLYDKMAPYEEQVRELITVPLSQNQFDALTIFTFNMSGGLKGQQRMVDAVNNNSNMQTMENVWMIYNKATMNGKFGVVPGLVSFP